MSKQARYTACYDRSGYNEQVRLYRKLLNLSWEAWYAHDQAGCERDHTVTSRLRANDAKSFLSLFKLRITELV